jgi:ketosteroid isomerase-like protein
VASANAEKVKATVDAFNRGNIGNALADAAPDFEFDLTRAQGPDAGIYSRDDVPEFFAEFAEHWDAVRIEADEFVEAGDAVYGTWTMHVRGRDGIEARSRVTWVWTFRDGELARATMYQERDEALEALGVAPS